MKDKPHKLTKSFVESLPPAVGGTAVFYFDTELKGFGVRVSGEAKTYVVQARVNGKKVRTSIGRHGVLTAEVARKKAMQLLASMAEGENPNLAKKQQQTQRVTLGEVFESYQEARTADGGLRPKTVAVYQSSLNRNFSDWLDRPVVEISRDMVIERYREIATTKGPRSKEGGAKAQAAQSMRVLKSLLNYAILAYEQDGQPLIPDNPVNRLSMLHRGWSKVPARSDVIAPSELKPWYRAVMKLDNGTMRDYLLVSLFMGIRRSAAAKLTWENLNLDSAVLTIPASADKTGKEQRLPLPTFVLKLLKSRKKLRRLDNPFIFEGEKPGSHIQEPKRAIANVVEKSKVPFSMHTLRRTFATTAERLDISYYKVKQLLNHAVSGDVTGQHYVRVDTEQLREPIQAIAAYFCEQMEIGPNSPASARRSRSH